MSDQELLLTRLLQKKPFQPRPIVFMVGSAIATQRVPYVKTERLEAPADPAVPDEIVKTLMERRRTSGEKEANEQLGVASAWEVVEIIKDLFRTPETPPSTNAILAGPSAAYQDAFEYLLRAGGPHVARFAVRRAIWLARRDGTVPTEAQFNGDELRSSEEIFREADGDKSGWNLTDATKALGSIMAEFPDRFGPYLLTTNYDPTLAASIRLARGQVVQTVIHGDGNPGQTLVEGCHLIHLHGYWHGYDTLHTRVGLEYPRPQLESFLCEVLRTCTVVVLGYGGWDDLFARAARRIANFEPRSRMDIVWAFYEDAAAQRTSAAVQQVKERLQVAEQDGARISYYGGIDCHVLLPELLRRLRVSGNAVATLGKPVDAAALGSALLIKVAQQGFWLHFTSHGNRRAWVLQEEGEARRFVGLDPARGVNESPDDKYRWTFDGRELELSTESSAFRTQGAFSGPIVFCFYLNKKFATPVLVEGWKKKWRDERGQEVPTQEHLKVDGIAAHVIPWPAGEDHEFANQSVIQGQWIKMSETGGTFVVQLHPDGTLTESYIFDITKRWHGVWWVDGVPGDRMLHLFIGSWCLHVPEALDDHQAENGLRLRKGFEDHPMRGTKPVAFYVAHVIPYSEGALEAGKKATVPA